MKTTKTKKQNMKILTIHDPHNTFIRTVLPYGSGWLKRDGDEFARQSKYAAKFYADECNSVVTPLVIPMNKKTAMKKRLWLFGKLTTLKCKGIKFDRILFFCHGAKYDLNRKMISMTKDGDVNTVRFCKKLGAIAAPGCGIVFYSCKTAAVTDGGFADAVSYETGRRVMGHTTSGHTTRNPYKRAFDENGYRIGLTRFISGFCNMWPSRGGIKQTKKLMNSHKYAPFMVVEEWLTK